MSVAVSAAPDGTLLAACAGEPGAGLQAKSAARSTDGGRSWAVIAGGRSSLLITRDGGIRWRMVRPLIGDSGGGTSQVIFFSRSRGVVLGEDGNDNELPAIWHTSDGGARWSAVLPRTG